MKEYSNTKISSFTGDYDFLSNFYHSEVSLDDEKYPSVELSKCFRKKYLYD